MTVVRSAAETKFLRLKWRIAINHWEKKLARWIDVAKTGFDPNQPRVPTGNPRGGQWTGGGGGGGGGHTVSRNESRILPDATPDHHQRGIAYTHARTGRPSRSRQSKSKSYIKASPRYLTKVETTSRCFRKHRWSNQSIQG
jgi:hypothetical protein